MDRVFAIFFHAGSWKMVRRRGVRAARFEAGREGKRRIVMTMRKCGGTVATVGIVALALVAAAGRASAAPTITWSTSIDNTSSLSFMTLPPGGSNIANFNLGGNTSTLGGETWYTGLTSGATYNDVNNGTAPVDSPPSGMSFYVSYPWVAWAATSNVSGSNGFSNDVLDNQIWQGNGPPFMDISGFTPGTRYQVQFVAADGRQLGDFSTSVQLINWSADPSPPHAITWQSLSQSPTVNYVAGFNGNPAGSFGVITADFIADASSLSFMIGTWNQPVTPPGNPLEFYGAQNGSMNGLRITAVPEPSLTLLGVAAAAGIVALRRRTATA
jgi:hypothetical protein